MNGTIKAIETRYKGYRFRSRLEARCAVFFDAMGIAWRYEDEGYRLSSGTSYLPDFWLPELGIYVEVKGEMPIESELEKARQLARDTKRSVLFMIGEIGKTTPKFQRCTRCNQINLIDHSLLINTDTNTYKMQWRSIGNFCGHNASVLTEEHAINAQQHAIEAARSARFEYGESGAA